MIGSRPCLRLHYAPTPEQSYLHRWVRPGSPGFFVLIVALVVSGTWWVWQSCLDADKQAFYKLVSVDTRTRCIIFANPPDAAALRHMARLPGKWSLMFFWGGVPDPSMPQLFRGRRFPNITTIYFCRDADVDAWLKELCRPDCGLTSVDSLSLWHSNVTDAGLRELARSDTGLKALRCLSISDCKVTDAGLSQLTRSGSGLKALVKLDLSETGVTDKWLMKLSGSDCGLKALASLHLGRTDTTEAAAKAVVSARPSLTIRH